MFSYKSLLQGVAHGGCSDLPEPQSDITLKVSSEMT